MTAILSEKRLTVDTAIHQSAATTRYLGDLGVMQPDAHVEVRNLPYDKVMELMPSLLNYRQYAPYGDIWVPNNLQQGDIIRCDLMTDFYKTGRAEIWPRNCLVLGVNVDPQTFDLQSIRLVRFSYWKESFTPEHELLVDPEDKYWRTQVSGLNRAAVLRTGKVEDVPPYSEFFGFFVERYGRILPEKFPEVLPSLKAGAGSDQFAYRNHAGVYAVNDGGSLFVPGLNTSGFDKARRLPLPTLRAETDYFSLAPQERENFEDAFQADRIRRVAVGSRQRTIDNHHINLSRGQAALKEEETLAYVRSLRRIARGDRLQSAVDETLVRLAEQTPATEKISVRKRRAQAIPLLATILEEQRAAAAEAANVRAHGLRRIKDQTIDPQSLADLETLGIGGLLREPTIHLPKQLWRGRYVFMRIPDLLDPSAMSDVAFRPCAIWNAYARIDQNGDPVLAGLELHPVTRGAAHAFTHKMVVRPVDTKVKRESYLIADMMVRAPISAEYFQPDQPNAGFYDLYPGQVAALGAKRALVEERGGFRIYGLQTVPDDWVPINLPDAPDERVREKIDRSWKKPQKAYGLRR